MFKDGRLGQTAAAEFFIVDSVVDRAARVIATAVRERRVVPRAELYEGVSSAQVDRFIAHAVAMGWCVLDGPGLIRSGPVNHWPVKADP